MPHDDHPELDEQRHKLEAIEARLARHETITRAIQISLTVLGLLTLTAIFIFFLDYLSS
jgi:hypothetical protein